jgi:hypothetical protein
MHIDSKQHNFLEMRNYVSALTVEPHMSRTRVKEPHFLAIAFIVSRFMYHQFMIPLGYVQVFWSFKGIQTQNMFPRTYALLQDTASCAIHTQDEFQASIAVNNITIMKIFAIL